ncbi:MAG: electron transfer flavoprotein-ubiquinone oxidoreductase [Alphaproteobacteria bacterium 32-64-14]|nr:MAG: electron transfer flavoprotein-ubiquinone oxidoreductase [Alphaproteobacteria bacterium 32-64-14]
MSAVGTNPRRLGVRIKQLAAETGKDVSVVVLEKGSEVGAHILSGAVMDPKAMNELIPDWKEKGCPFETAVTKDTFIVLGEQGSIPLPVFLMPPMLQNHGMYIGSLGNVTRWMASQAEALGVDVYPGFAASDFTYREDGSIKGVIAGVMGIEKNGEPGPNYSPGMELNGKYVLIGEGVRGSLAKKVIKDFKLDKDSQPQKFGIGVKELWQVPAAQHRPGYVQHTFGWPLGNSVGGGSFLYHFGDRYVAVGMVVHLNYKNPWLSPFEEFQRFKHHPEVSKHLKGGERVSYGARAITEGGWQSIPKLTFPGGALIGCSAGFVNLPRIKGSHNAMKTGMLAGEAAFAAVVDGRQGDELKAYAEAFKTSWVATELKKVRNAKPLWSRFGTALGISLTGFDLWVNTLFGGFSFFGTMKHGKNDAKSLEPAAKHKKIVYPKPDGVLSFDRLTSVAFSFTNHGEDQPAHLKVLDMELQKKSELGVFAGPSNRYCPAGVYEWIEDGKGDKKFQINAQNCVHCKTCDIKDPNQNINWTTPEGGGGPNYPNM